MGNRPEGLIQKVVDQENFNLSKSNTMTRFTVMIRKLVQFTEQWQFSVAIICERLDRFKAQRMSVDDTRSWRPLAVRR
jgi:hypothetical protein